jgi:hypothetical protein
MLIENIHAEYWLVRQEGGKFGPFYKMEEVYACIRLEELSDYELKTFLSYIPF